LNKETIYYKNWWRENRERVLKHRKERYQNDSKYREAIVRRSKRQTRDNKINKQYATKCFVPLKIRELFINVNGHNTRVYSFNLLSRVINKVKSCISGWERKGWIPKAYRINGNRFYTASQILLVEEVVNKYSFFGLNRGKRKVNGRKMYADLLERWNYIDENDDEKLKDLIEKKTSLSKIKFPVIHTRKIEIKGEMQIFYPIGVLCRETRKSNSEIKKLEKQKIIPKTPFIDDRGWRWYSNDMILSVKEELNKEIDGTTYQKIAETWKKLGVF
jgi:DNA-binding transcriptional MerR regulator